MGSGARVSPPPPPTSDQHLAALCPVIRSDVPPSRLLAAGTITSQAWAQEEPGSVTLGEARGLTIWTGGAAPN